MDPTHLLCRYGGSGENTTGWLQNYTITAWQTAQGPQLCSTGPQLCSTSRRNWVLGGTDAAQQACRAFIYLLAAAGQSFIC
jgi:hypothetical protein